MEHVVVEDLAPEVAGLPTANDPGTAAASRATGRMDIVPCAAR
jgi:hypothetical protein